LPDAERDSDNNTIISLSDCEHASVSVHCINEQCPAQALNKLTYFASKHAMNIDGLGKSVAKKLLDANLVNQCSDLFTLSKEELLTLPGFKDRSAENLLDAIKKARESCSLARVLVALGISGIGRTSAPTVASVLDYKLERLLQVDQDTLLQIDGVGEKTARSIVAHVANPSARDEIKALMRLGIGEHQVAPQAGSRFK